MSAAPMPAAAISAAAAAARAWLRNPGSEEQEVMEQCASSALLLAEAFTGDLLIRRAVEETVAASPSEWRRLAATPVSAIEAPAEGHAVDIDAEGCGWVRAAGPVTVHYTAGLAEDWAGLPAPVAQGVVMLAAHLFEDRGRATQPPAAVAALWRPHRRMRLSMERGA